MSNDLLEAFRDAAIKAHIGFKHEGPWDACGWIECEDRRKMIDASSLQPPSKQSEEFVPSIEAIETAERLAFPAVGKIKIPEWRAMVNEIAATLDAERSRGAELQREVDAQLMCNLCRRPSDYHPAAIDEYGDWRHRRINHEKEWDEVCAASAIRAAKQQ